MIADFSMYPIGGIHRSKDVARALEILVASGLPFRIGPVGSCVEGDWDGVMAVIRRCQQAVAEGLERVVGRKFDC